VKIIQVLGDFFVALYIRLFAMLRMISNLPPTPLYQEGRKNILSDENFLELCPVQFF
jgi:hypothetical protein